MKITLIAGALILLIGAPVALYVMSAAPALSFAAEPKAIAAASRIEVGVESAHGVRLLEAVVVQGGARTAARIEQGANRLTFWRTKQPAAVYVLALKAGPGEGFKSGPATLTVRAVANDLRGAEVSRVFPVTVMLAPPRVTADGAQHYINQGGAELVTFSVSGYWTDAGVKVGGQRFRSYPLPGAKNENERFCLFVFPWDTPAGTEPLVYAMNPAGQEATAAFWHRVKEKQFRQRKLELDDAFLQKAVNEIAPEGSGPLLERFLKINRETRKANNATLAGLREESEARLLWKEPFEQMTNSKVEAFFADVRTYTYDGKDVDRQVHLGFDLSKVRQAPVASSNAGKVVYAERLGIYGLCVVVDHGYGLQSIYAHLSSIGVKKGQMVGRGEELGRSGATGLAGGDHLHYSMQIDGVQTNPIEWWDAHWIEDRIFSKLPH